MANADEIDTLIERTNFESMLEFEVQIFLDIIHKDGLVVAAKGLNLELVTLNIIKAYCDPGNLVLILNSTEQEEKFFTTKAGNEHIYSTTFTTNTTNREDVYLSGGIHFITTRILVVDMLKGRVPIDKITGLIILRAHTVMESCQEAFVLRLFRQKNKTGFIKAFSNSVQSFTMGFGHVERVMRALFVKELYIWPRFHSLVTQSLKQHEPQVIELHIPISDLMDKIQSYLLELMNLTVKELKRINKTIELQEISVENCLIKKFQKILQLQLDGIWNQLSTKSKQLVADLKTLRHLITVLMYSDSVTFYSMLSQYRTREYAQTATWIFLESAELLFTQANALVYSGDKELNPKLSPKWKTLLEILKVEIPNEIGKSREKDNIILILCYDKKTCHQLNHILTHGPNHYLFLMALKYGISFKTINESFRNLENLPKNIDSKDKTQKPPNKKVKCDDEDKSKSEDDGLENFQNSYLLTMSQLIRVTDENNGSKSEYVFEPFTELENMDITQFCETTKTPTIIIQTFKGLNDFTNLQRSLNELNPSHIVMYHSNISAIREIEMYEAHRKREKPLKVYFLIHTETVEEQSYLTTLRREKEAFEFLIETKSTMVIPEDQDGKSDLCLALQRHVNTPEKSTRQGGQSETQIERRFIIVDLREFRSELPALIHKRGIDIEPVTITVGDYILTPELCIERKSLSDLVGSLNSGRLYQQCTQMSRYYAKPMLLIEFDQNKTFSWQSHFMISSDSNNFDIQQKLLLLTLHFPKLKIIWSPSPYATAQLFDELKEGKEEPDVSYASSIGSAEDVELIETKYNSTIYDFVQKLPGITSKNIDGFLRNTTNLDAVIAKSKDELIDILGNAADADAFYTILHNDHNPKEDNNQSKQKQKNRNKFKFVKKKV